jgi:tRNA-2-methylthio-N6-dimethylallyladenosine synthase
MNGSTGKLYIETVGCQMNVLDSELVVGALRRQGYSLVEEPREADVILFNTCSVRQHAEDKIYSALGRLRAHMEHNPRKVLGILGCMAQKDQDKILTRAPHVDLVCGTGQLARVPELIEEVRRTGRPQLALSLSRKGGSRHEVEASFESFDPPRDAAMRPTPFQAFVRIQIGCDKFCTYCVVPSTRGPEQSRHPDHIVEESRRLAAEGCREVTLLGQTVNSYRYPMGDGRFTRLSDLLERLNAIEGLDRVRFITNYPLDMTDDLLDAVRDLPKVVKYLHVPAQSGCDDMLLAMKRQYTVAQYREMMHRIRERCPVATVSSDFIVGFPGETEESFEKTMRLTEECRFKNSYIFKYSPRPGTRAIDKFVDDVPEETKKRRNNDLLVVQNANSLRLHRAMIGQEVDVLVEGKGKTAISIRTGLPQLSGKSMADHIVVFDGPERLIGQIVKARVEDATAFTLFARVETAELASGEHQAREGAVVAPADSCSTDSHQAGIDSSTGRLSLPLA